MGDSATGGQRRRFTRTAQSQSQSHLCQEISKGQTEPGRHRPSSESQGNTFSSTVVSFAKETPSL